MPFVAKRINASDEVTRCSSLLNRRHLPSQAWAGGKSGSSSAYCSSVALEGSGLRFRSQRTAPFAHRLPVKFASGATGTKSSTGHSS